MKQTISGRLLLLVAVLAGGIGGLRATQPGEGYRVFLYNGLLVGNSGTTWITDYTDVGWVSAEQLGKGIEVQWGVETSGDFRVEAHPTGTPSPTEYMDMGAAAVPLEKWDKRSAWSWDDDLQSTGIEGLNVGDSSPCAGVAKSRPWGLGNLAKVSLQLEDAGCSSCKGGGGNGGGSGGSGGTEVGGGTGGVAYQGVSIGIPLGGLGTASSRDAAGSLRVREEAPRAAIGSPESLQYGFSGSGVTVTRDSGTGFLSSVVTPEVTVTVTVLTASSYKVVVTPTVANSTLPVRKTVIERLDNDGKQILITETQTFGSISKAKAWKYDWDGARNGWYLAIGYAAGDYLKKEFRGEAIVGGVLTITEEKYSPGPVLSAKSVKAYRNLNADDTTRDIWMETSATEGSGGLTRTTTTTYYDTWPGDGEKYRQVHTVTTPENVVTTFTYDGHGRELTRTENYPGSLPDRVTTMTYGPDLSGTDPYGPLTETVTVGGQTVEYTEYTRLPYEVITKRYSASGKHVENRQQRYDASSSKGKQRAEHHEDGTLTTYAYSSASGVDTVTTDTGEPNGSGTAVLSGIRTLRRTQQNNGRLVSDEVWDIATGLLLASRGYGYDELGRVTTITYEDQTTEIWSYEDCCGTLEYTTRDGAVHRTERDDAGRVAMESGDGIVRIYECDGSDRVVKETDATGKVLRETDYDILGRVEAERVPSPAAPGTLEETRTSYNANWLEQTTTNPLNGTRITTSRADGKPASLGGTAANPRTYEHGANSQGEFTKEYLGTTTGATEWVLTQYDWLGRVVSVEYPDGNKAWSFYNNLGQLWKQVDPDGVVTLLTYDGEGRQKETGIDIDRLDSLTAGTDRIRYTEQSVVNESGHPLLRTESGWRTGTGDVVENILARSPGGLFERRTVFGAVSTSGTMRLGNGQLETTVENADGTKEVIETDHGRETSRTRFDSADVELTSTSFGYDDYKRLQTRTESDLRSTTYTYNDADLVESETRTGTSVPTLATFYGYDKLGRRTTVTLPDTTTQHTEYWPRGEVKKTYGSQIYPVDYTYDDQSRMLTMTTQGAAGNAVTTWSYDPQRGWLAHKWDNANKSTDYTYTDAGRLKTRKWARGPVTTYDYDDAGTLQGVDYSDATPDVSAITYDDCGRRKTVTDAGGARTFNYAGGHQLAEEANTTLNWSVTRGYDSLNRRNSLASSVWPTGLIYAYSPTTGRLSSITQGTMAWNYKWKESLGAIREVEATNSGNVALTMSRTFDGHGRLDTITSSNGTVVAQQTYGYDSLGRRTRGTREDTTWWHYGYDSFGQVTSGVKKTSAGTGIPGYDYGYLFDSIGNRTQTTINGRQEDYTPKPNALNQYTAKENAGMIDVAGTAEPTASVTVNGTPATRQGAYFAGTAAGDNSVAAISITANIHAVKPGAGPNGKDVATLETKSGIVPPANESFTYDDDGNLTADGLWAYGWDGENQLISVTPKAGLEALLGKKFAYGYDADGRKIWSETDTWAGMAWTGSPSRDRHVYDGWNLLAIHNETSTTVTHRFTWGPDLSGTQKGAGGIGGLLRCSFGGGDHLPFYDGNGNVLGLYGAIQGAVTARYEYGPFGELLEMSGSAAEANPFRWSTKFSEKTGLVYYGYRYYCPVTGRWPSRDPIGERGGVNLYGMVANSPVDSVDFLGEISIGTKILAIYTARTQAGTSPVGNIINRLVNHFNLTDDENEMLSLSKLEVERFYSKWLKDNKDKLKCEWKSVNIPQTNAAQYAGCFNVSMSTNTGGWLHNSSNVLVNGKTEARLASGGKYEMRNRSLNWRWDDVINANDYGGISPETIWNRTGQRILRNDFSVSIPYTDNRTEVLPY